MGMTIDEVIKWLMIMKANLNSFPEVSNAKKIEALAEAIRLLKNEQSINKIDCDHTECRNCTNHKYCDYEISSSGKPNKSEIPTGSTTENDLGIEKIEVRKPCINYEDGCEEWAGCPCVHFKARK